MQNTEQLETKRTHHRYSVHVSDEGAFTLWWVFDSVRIADVAQFATKEEAEAMCKILNY